MKKYLLAILFIAVFLSGCVQQTNEYLTPDYVDISAVEAKELIDSTLDVIILDVAPAFDYEAGHIPGAVNIYVGELSSRLDELDSSKAIMIYCRTAGASLQAAQILVDAGFGTVYRISDHYSGWVNAGYEVTTGSTLGEFSDGQDPEIETTPGTELTALANIVDYDYSPSELHVAVGTTVTWTNEGNMQHTVTSNTGLFDSGLLSNGATFSYAFDTAGTYDYYCIPHPFMIGSVVVG
ncbi:MAG: rhodanese-like domain-containing protein [Candidatus Nanoarchaeia archaeon]|nr:rhodanese-like domain-containing protein [Candidatus Nanoarchaeia archaeon]